MKLIFAIIFIFILIDLDWVEILVADTNVAKYTKACNTLAKCIHGKAVVLHTNDDFVCQLTNQSGRKGFLSSSSYFKLEITKCQELVEESSDYNEEEE